MLGENVGTFINALRTKRKETQLYRRSAIYRHTELAKEDVRGKQQ
jgi:hypothetical protein